MDTVPHCVHLPHCVVDCTPEKQRKVTKYAASSLPISLQVKKTITKPVPFIKRQ
jgi:hypothetical protein